MSTHHTTVTKNTADREDWTTYEWSCTCGAKESYYSDRDAAEAEAADHQAGVS